MVQRVQERSPKAAWTTPSSTSGYGRPSPPARADLDILLTDLPAATEAPGTPLSLLISRKIVTVGGKFTNRCTWPVSPLNSHSCAPKSAYRSRMISSIRSR